MNILITGIPATGKSTIAKELAHYGFKNYCDKDFVTKKNAKDIVEYKHKMKDVDLVKFSKTVNAKLKLLKNKNIILDGILFPYCLHNVNITLDYVFILSLNEKELRKRYKQRKYPEAKILDNLFVQENNLFYETILNEYQKSKKKTQPYIVEITLSGKLDKDLSKIVDLIYATYLGKF